MSDPRRPAVRKAVALRYERGTDKAPRVVAKGDRLLADRIVEIARVHRIHVHEDPDLVAALATLEVDREIPESLYYAVAEVLAFVYHLNQKMDPPKGTP
jgi:flagellar biosynthesis protein